MAIAAARVCMYAVYIYWGSWCVMFPTSSTAARGCGSERFEEDGTNVGSRDPALWEHYSLMRIIGAF